MLRIAGVLAALVLGLSAAHTKGTVGEGQRVLRGARLPVCFVIIIVGGCGQNCCAWMQRDDHLIQRTN